MRVAGEGVLARQRLAHPCGEHRTHIIGQQQRFGVERLDDRTREIGRAGHDARKTTPDAARRLLPDG